MIRLSHIVRAIENDVQCVPKGSYFMTPQHELAPSQKFYGLTEDNCQDLSSWLHFRSPQSEESRKKIEDCNVVFCDDFLDNL